VARSLSSRKRLRQNAKRAIRNKARKSEIKTQLRRLTDAIGAKDATAAEKELRVAAKILDRNAGRRTIHPNTAARRKSRMARRVNSIRAAAKK
jgi:small subunit ribosomal protein S20